jgi:Asp-tRNA(Asn)/Glu-tRNA(Gln) amidotransferase A subunit family amidase
MAAMHDTDSAQRIPDSYAAKLPPYALAVAGFRSGTSSPRAYLDQCLANIDAAESQVLAFVHLALEPARAAADRSAERWRAGRPLSPIDGMPVAVKDVLETVDMPTQMGSPLFKDWQSNRDAAAVAALREAGAVIIGKSVTTEFASTVPRQTRNPWDLAHTPGGSSSGSAAAVAAGFVPAGLGTQVVGSIIRPASYCGCVGYKPTYGAINRGGSLDYLSQSCNGVIAGSLADTWNVAWQISSRVGGDPGFPGLFGEADIAPPRKPRSVAVLPTEGWDRADGAARQQLENVLERLAGDGIAIVRPQQSELLARAEAAMAGAARLTREINAWEWLWPLNTFRARDEAGLSRASVERHDAARAMTVSDYRALLAIRAAARTLWAQLADTCDLALTLAAPAGAPRGLDSTGDPTFAVPASFLGVPALSLPAFRVGHLPLGLQAVGFADRDDALFGHASWLSDKLGIGV